jgi:hypothetical protein
MSPRFVTSYTVGAVEMLPLPPLTNFPDPSAVGNASNWALPTMDEKEKKKKKKILDGFMLIGVISR